MKFSAKADFSGPMKMLKDISAKHIPAARSAALNRAAKAVQTEVVRGMSAQEHIKQKIIRRRIRFQSRDRATQSKAYSQIFIITTPMPVIYQGQARQDKKGTTAGGSHYSGAFIKTMNHSGNHTGVYKRVGSRRLPIKEVKKQLTFNLPQKTLDAANKRGKEVFQSTFQHELQYRIEKK